MSDTTNTVTSIGPMLKDVYPRTKKLLRGCKKDCTCKKCKK